MANIGDDIHSIPFANRIIEELIKKWLDARTASALNAATDISDYEKGKQRGIEEMRYIYLDSYAYILVPRIVEHLKRAGLLVKKQ